VHNPGTIADQRYMNLADITVVFEQTYDAWTNLTAANALAQLDYNRNNLCILMHSVPDDLSVDGLGLIEEQMQLYAKNVFMTDLDADYYRNFSNLFADFIDALSISISV
jgi:hypothetical protein